MMKLYYFLKIIYLKIKKFVVHFNLYLPKIFRITKWSILTSFIALIFSTNVVFAKECSNLDVWLGNQNCDASSKNEGMIPGIIKTFNSILKGNVQPTADEDSVPQTQRFTVDGGFLNLSNNLIVMIYENNDQISGTGYVETLANSSGLVQPVQAQQTGFTSFQPVMNIWKAFRDIALGFILLIGFAFSMMILFRLSQGQTAVTIMNALPKLIIGIFLIVFSYPIAGLFVDSGNVLQKLVVNIFWDEQFIDTKFINGCSEGGKNYYPYNMYADPSLGCGFSNNCQGNQDCIDASTETYFQDFNIFRLMSRFTEFETWGTVPCDTGTCYVKIQDIIRTPTGISVLDKGIGVVEFADDVAKELLDLVITIVITMNVIKIFFALVKAFTEMIIYTIFAPFVFLVYPLSPGVLMTWVRYMLTASLLFPATFMMMLLAAIIAGDPNPPWFTTEVTNIAGAAPNLLSYSINVQLDSANSESFLTRIVAIMIIFMIPTLPAFLQQTLKASESMLYRGAVDSFKGVATKIPFIGGMFNM